MDEDMRKRVWAGWAALKGACRECHKSGPGGAAMCYCGRGGGGTEACAMLRTLRDFVEALEPGQVPERWREWLAALKRTA